MGRVGEGVFEVLFEVVVFEVVVGCGELGFEGRVDGLNKRVRVLEGEFNRRGGSGGDGGGGGLGLERLEDSDAHEGRERRDLVGDEFLDSEFQSEVLREFEEGLAGGGDRERVVRNGGEHVVLGGAKPRELLG